MTAKPLTTVWMWKNASNDEVWALTANLNKQKLEWSDSIGCACGDSFAEQTFADFLEKGPRYGEPPEDVVAEVYETLRAVAQ